jgi:hypothetical protein
VTVSNTGWPTAGLAGVTDSVTEAAGLTLTSTVAGVAAPALAVTVAFLFVVSDTSATPFWSVIAVVELNVPAVVEKLTGTPATGLLSVELAPPVTLADISTVPPLAATVDGFARTEIFVAAAEPTVIFTTFVVVAAVPVPLVPAAPPEMA